MAKIVKTSAKIAVALGAVYITLDQGVWSSTSKLGTQALDDVKARFFPATNQFLDKVPSTKCVKVASVNAWNSGVQKSFNAIAALPDTACHYSTVAINKIKEGFSS